MSFDLAKTPPVNTLLSETKQMFNKLEQDRRDLIVFTLKRQKELLDQITNLQQEHDANKHMLEQLADKQPQQ